ncbi:MAG: right-handed parallel beta-helix repeat-containing protein [Candidatus Thermoplasmatota archaeon]
MKKIVNCLLFFILLLFPTVSTALNDSHIVLVDDDGDGDFQSIQKAVDVATEGDIIKVYSGTYIENIEINKSLSLIGVEEELGAGSDMGKPVILGSNKTAINVSHTQMVEVSNFSIQNSSFGVILIDSFHCSIKQNNISNCTFSGMKIQSVDNERVFNISVTGNYIFNNYAGVVIGPSFASSCIILEGNSIAYNEMVGLGIAFVRKVLVEKNNFIENGVEPAVSQVVSVFSLATSFSHNFWSDWQKDTPREIPLFKKDRNPADESYNIK